jgi:hypothetical protein
MRTGAQRFGASDRARGSRSPGAALGVAAVRCARMVDASCHCGAVAISVGAAPLELRSCDCSICRRTGALWSYYSRPGPGRRPDGDLPVGRQVARSPSLRDLRLHHALVAARSGARRMGVNARLTVPAIVAAVRVRRFDGADTWTFLESSSSRRWQSWSTTRASYRARCRCHVHRHATRSRPRATRDLRSGCGSRSESAAARRCISCRARRDNRGGSSRVPARTRASCAPGCRTRNPPPAA